MKDFIIALSLVALAGILLIAVPIAASVIGTILGVVLAIMLVYMVLCGSDENPTDDTDN